MADFIQTVETHLPLLRSLELVKPFLPEDTQPGTQKTLVGRDGRDGCRTGVVDLRHPSTRLDD